MAEERTERATHFRRRRFRERGMVASSRDLTAAMALLGAFAALRLLGPWMTASVARDTCRLFLSASQASLSSPVLMTYFRQVLWTLVRATGPVLLAASAGAVLGSWLQTGFLFTLYPLIPSTDKINPVNGFRRLFSWQGLFDTLKSIAKMALLLLIAYWTLAPHKAALVSLGLASLPDGLAKVGRVATVLTLRCGLAMLVLGAADYAFVWWQTERRMMMTRQEMREELKETEGDPMIALRRRRRRRELLDQLISPEMREATVVLTNPTHLAVALLYRPSSGASKPAMPAPKVVAKGRGPVARRIVTIARTYNIPVVENVALARALYRNVRVGDYIPRALYRAVAEILALIYRRQAERRERIRRHRAA
ncbi:MAG: EscU/YscU/HrcU family type III secretion system export apparatus switch protein [Armatimonadetes bacterium]|nr:EscU/YscU/HrcU family type III secretion system export apparatus switch protein [Armatimonadota bacterium]